MLGCGLCLVLSILVNGVLDLLCLNVMCWLMRSSWVMRVIELYSSFLINVVAGSVIDGERVRS